MKQDVTRLLAVCSHCHKAYPANEMDGYTCDACKDALADEPAKVEWDAPQQ